MATRHRVSAGDGPPPSVIPEVLALVKAASAEDGVAPFSEHALLALRHGRARHLLAYEDDTLVGYAHLDRATEAEGGSDAEGASGELVVHPEWRRRGHGRALAEALVAEAGGPLRVWAHGDLPAAARLAEALDFVRVRALFQMRRPFTGRLSEDGQPAAELPGFTVPEGVRIRTFELGRDEEAWLAVNRRAFADHAEQGAWVLDDVLQREREDWFDPAGFFLAERDGGLVGFHWTKVHPDGVGEVYVVGVDPDAQGLGLGRTLTLAGLHHLRELGLEQVLLYVDESNTAAVRLYESLGFTRWAVDVMYGAS